MQERHPALQQFLDSLHAVLATEATVAAARPSVARIFKALETPVPARTGQEVRLPACACLGDALATARAAGAPLARVA
ncbi:MAG: hypothetical protein WBA15_13250, partial [Mesorhizobium sp.]